jgi:hypothetical protein
MDGGAFIWLKGARIGPKSVKQAEIRLAVFVKTLSIDRRLRSNLAPKLQKTREGCIFGNSAGMANASGIVGFVI